MSACILQAAQTGARSRLFLLDEVDAALDESNQACVAMLLKQMCSSGAGCQCLCVTHSAAFQANCDALVQVGNPPFLCIECPTTSSWVPFLNLPSIPACRFQRAQQGRS
jgi:ABC-type hemin transport system ATPase subunit